jgi:hypothetical protein
MYPTCSSEMCWNGPTCWVSTTSRLSTPYNLITISYHQCNNFIGRRHIVLTGILCSKGNEMQLQIHGNTFCCHHNPCHFEHFNIGIDIVHNGQQSIQRRWIKQHNSMVVLTFTLRIMNVQLCKLSMMSFNRTHGSNFVIKFTLNAKWVWSSASCYWLINFCTERSEC